MNNSKKDKFFDRIMRTCIILTVTFLISILISLLFTIECTADQITINLPRDDISLTEVCINRNVFLVTTSGAFNDVRGVSTIQVMRYSLQQKVLIPLRCTPIQNSVHKFTSEG